jgi:hypothetical protein
VASGLSPFPLYSSKCEWDSLLQPMSVRTIYLCLEHFCCLTEMYLYIVFMECIDFLKLK